MISLKSFNYKDAQGSLIDLWRRRYTSPVFSQMINLVYFLLRCLIEKSAFAQLKFLPSEQGIIALHSEKIAIYVVITIYIVVQNRIDTTTVIRKHVCSSTYFKQICKRITAPLKITRMDTKM